MEDLQLALTSARVDQKNFGLWLKSWQVGQVLQALVTDKAPSGEIVLRIGGNQITATADIPVQKGAVLMLEVSSLNPAPTLKIISVPQSDIVQADPLNGRLQLLLPQQGAVVDPIATLLSSAQSANFLSLLGVKGDVLERLFKHLSSPSRLVDPKQLKMALAQSGLFLEADMRQLATLGGQLVPGDLKSGFLRLLHRVNRRLEQLRSKSADQSSLEPLVKLKRQLEGAIASITLDQLSAAQTDDSGAIEWSFELPVRFKDAVKALFLTVRREKRSSDTDDEQQDWKACLSLSLPTLGVVEADLFLRGQKVSVVLFSEDQNTYALIEGELDKLKAGLESRGLDVSMLLSRQGLRPSEKNNARLIKCVDEKV